MEHLPPVGWADVATKRDLDQLAAVTKGDLELLAVRVERLADVNQQEHEALKFELLATFREEMSAQTRTLFFAVAGLNLTTVGLVFAAARLG